MRKFIRRLPLQVILTVLLVLLVLITGGLASVLAFRNGQAAVNGLAHQLHQEVTARINQHLDGYLEIPHLINRLNLDSIRLGQLDVRDLDGLERHFLTQIQHFDAVSSIDYADEQMEYVAALQKVLGADLSVGRADAATGHALNVYNVSSSGRRELIQSVPDYDPRPRPWYQAAVQAGHETWTPIYMWSSGAVGLDAVMPVYAEDGHVLGVLAASLTLDHIGEFLRGSQVSKHGAMFIVDQSGILVASSTLTETFTRTGNELNLIPAVKSADPLVQAATYAMQKQAGGLDGISRAQSFGFELNGQRQSAMVTPYQDVYGLKWLIVTVIPESDFMSQIQAGNRTTGGLIVAAIIAAIVSAILMARWVTQPLLRLNHSAQALAQGDWSQKVVIDRPDEIGDLAHSIHQMAGQLQEAFYLLQSSEERFRLLAENSTDMISRYSLDGVYLYVSPSCQTLLGYSPEELVGHSVFEFIQPDDIPNFEQSRTTIVEQQVVSTTAYRVRHKNLTYVWFETTSHAIHDPQTGNAIEIHAASRDITERKQAEEALRASEQKFRSFIEQSWDLITLFDEDGRLSEWNKACEQLTGLTKQQAMGGMISTMVRQLAVDEERAQRSETITQQMAESFNTGQSPYFSRRLEMPIRAANGEQRVIEQVVFPIKSERGYQIGSISRDITERKRVEEALRVSEERLTSFMDSASDGFYILDSNLNFVELNKKALEIIGKEKEDVIGRNLLDVVPDAKQSGRYEKHLNVIRTGKPFVIEDFVPHPIFGARHFVLTSFRVGDGLGVIAHDITERKQHEQELQAIAELSAALRTAPTRAEMLPVIVQQVVSLLNCDAVTIEIIDPHTGDSIVEAGRGSWEHLVGSRQRKGTGINAIISETLQPYHTHDLENEPDLLNPKGVHSGIRGSAGVPLIAQEKLIGFIWAGRKTDMAENEVELLSAITDIAANAIHRATLHEQTRKDAAELALAYDTTLEGWASALELRDQETVGHTLRVVEKTLELAQRMGMGEDQLENIRRGTLLHDIGKMGIPDSVLLKPGTLTEREWEIMHRHPEYAYGFLSPIDYLRPALDIPYCHHEKWDGTGYPRGLRGEEIPPAARIFAVVDVWDALTNDRPYRPSWSRKKALEYIRQQSGKHFDPEVVEVFLKLLNDPSRE
jgi:PAS domain S-box-containing protein